jgi:hypothetical protein
VARFKVVPAHASTHKKVIVRRPSRFVSGYVSPANFVVDGKLELLNTSGNVVAVDLRDIGRILCPRVSDSGDEPRAFTTGHEPKAWFDSSSRTTK